MITMFFFGVVIVDFSDKKIHSIAVLLKQFLMELSDPVIPFALYNKFMDSHDEDTNKNINNYKILLSSLPTTNYTILKYLLEFLVEIAKYSESNLMHYSNLGVVFGPSLIRPPIPDTFTLMNSTNSKIIELFVEHYRVLFEDN